VKIIDRTANIINIYHVLPTKDGSIFSANIEWRDVIAITTEVHFTQAYVTLDDVTLDDFGYLVSVF